MGTGTPVFCQRSPLSQRLGPEGGSHREGDSKHRGGNLESWEHLWNGEVHFGVILLSFYTYFLFFFFGLDTCYFIKKWIK